MLIGATANIVAQVMPASLPGVCSLVAARARFGNRQRCKSWQLSLHVGVRISHVPRVIPVQPPRI